jgi:glycosyltransferase involved in cell wall biosynthesis
VQELRHAVEPLTGRAAAIVPCLAEAGAIGPVVVALVAHGLDPVIVVDGGSTDGTAEVARAAGATLLVERRRGYGRALMTGVAALPADVEIVLFVDGDGSDELAHVPALIGPVRRGEADFVLGSRLRGPREAGALGPAQIVAGRLAGLLIRLVYGVPFTDMSPYRAIRRDALDELGMADESYGWNLEMQMRAAAAGLVCGEIPVGQKRRAGGVSKVSGRLGPSVKAAWIIARTFATLAARLPRSAREA